MCCIFEWLTHLLHIQKLCDAGDISSWVAILCHISSILLFSHLSSKSVAYLGPCLNPSCVRIGSQLPTTLLWEFLLFSSTATFLACLLESLQYASFQWVLLSVYLNVNSFSPATLQTTLQTHVIAPTTSYGAKLLSLLIQMTYPANFHRLLIIPWSWCRGLKYLFLLVLLL